MNITCPTCQAIFDDQYRLTLCPHDTFAANDGNNNFQHHPESTLIRTTADDRTKKLFDALLVISKDEPTKHAPLARYELQDRDGKERTLYVYMVREPAMAAAFDNLIQVMMEVAEEPQQEKVH